MAKLKNLRHEKFCLEYSISLNATNAYKAVYGSPKGAENSASKLLGNPKVKARIKELSKKKEEKAEIKSFDVIKEIERIAKAKMIDVFQYSGGFLTIKSLEDIPEECQSAIESIETISLGEDKGVAMKIKFHSKIKALELLARHFGMFNDNLNITAKPKTIEDLLNSAKG
jgi:phage terminase small subunit